MESLMNFLLLTVLFVAGFVNFLFYFPTKKFTVWFQSLKPSPPKSHLKSTPAAAIPPPPPSAGNKKKRKTAELKRVFGTFDKNNDGFITKKELMESLKNIRISITEGEAEELLKGVDENGDGLIDFEEFCVLGEKLLMGSSCEEEEEEKKKRVENQDDEDEDELREAFGVFDKDKDGMISVEELSLVLTCLGLNEGKKFENCKEMIKKVDLDGDGMVNFDEFKMMMMRTGATPLVS